MGGTNRDAADPVGTAAALVLGVCVGVALAVPALPPGVSLRVGGASLGTVEAALFAGALSVLLLPLGIIVLYQVFSHVD